jgi:hypothetical protein
VRRPGDVRAGRFNAARARGNCAKELSRSSGRTEPPHSRQRGHSQRRKTRRILHTRTREEIEDFLLQKLSSGLAISSDDVDVNQPFSSFGMDRCARSLSSMRSSRGWAESISTLFWDYPTIAELAAHLASDTPEQTVARSGRS